MFTGIIEKIGKVVRIGTAATAGADVTGAVRLVIEAPDFFDELAFGASVSINGVCLTIADKRGPAAGFDVIPETWRQSNLERLGRGDHVNLERAMRVGGRFDGHFVQGHVDAIGTVDRIERTGNEWKAWIHADPQVMQYIVRKGSIAIDGVSLTVADVDGTRFSVAVIPTTLRETTLSQRTAGDPVNLETDIIARTVLSRLAALGIGADTPPSGTTGSNLTLDHLREQGFAP